MKYLLLLYIYLLKPFLKDIFYVIFLLQIVLKPHFGQNYRMLVSCLTLTQCTVHLVSLETCLGEQKSLHIYWHCCNVKVVLYEFPIYIYFALCQYCVYIIYIINHKKNKAITMMRVKSPRSDVKMTKKKKQLIFVAATLDFCRAFLNQF